MKYIYVVLFVFCYIVISNQIFAQVPRTISYQGLLTDTSGVPKANGNYSLTFRLYNVSSGGTALWEESKSVQTKKGVFSVLLGESTQFPNSLDFNQQYWLGVQLGANSEMTPRTKLASVPYSINSVHSDTADYVKNAPGGSVSWALINNNLYSTNTGGVGIGTNSPQYKLDVLGPIRSSYGSSNDIVVRTTGGTNSWAKYWLQTPNQSWSLGTSQNFNGDQFYLSDQTFGGHRIEIQPNGGNVVFPNSVSNSVIVQTTGSTNSWSKLYLQTLSQNWSIGTSRDFNGNQLFFSDETGGNVRMAIMPTGNVGIGTTNPAAKLDVNGNVNINGNTSVNGNAIQPRDNNGFVKAMVRIRADGTILKSYSAYNTTISSVHITTGYYQIDFGFNVSDRFISVTPCSQSLRNSWVNVYGNSGGPVSVNKVDIYTYSSDFFDSDFYVFIY